VSKSDSCFLFNGGPAAKRVVLFVGCSRGGGGGGSFLFRRLVRRLFVGAAQTPRFSAWGEIFGDEATAVAMIDRLVHHAEILSLKGDSYRLRDKDLGTPRPRLTDPLRSAPPSGLHSAGRSPPHRRVHFQPARRAGGGPLFNRRGWPTFQPALTCAAAAVEPLANSNAGAPR
jgi:hypothetical protein